MALNIDNEKIKVVDGVLTKYNDPFAAEIVIPDGVTELAGYAIHSIEGKVMHIPASVEVIRKCAIFCTFNLETVYIENPQIYMEVRSFDCHSGIKNLYIGGQSIESVVTQNDDNVWLEKYIGKDKSYSIDSDITVIGPKAFFNNVELESVVIPQSVRDIEMSAFRECTSLREINLPDSLRIISGYAFENCKNIRELTVPPSVHFMSYGVFRGWTRNQIIRVPSNFKKLRFLQKWRRGCKATIVYC